MPLAFDSVSHGKIAFGFFNIESDMLLLEHYFFFADEFCRNISETAGRRDEEKYETAWSVFDIESPAAVGDLMGAIRGIRFTGFIGETYRKYPFPERQEDFKQNPDGHKTQAEFLEMIKEYGAAKEIPFIADPETKEAAIGEYGFTPGQFHELINYVWLGGMPRWKDNERPEYVYKIKEQVKNSNNWLFEGISFRG